MNLSEAIAAWQNNSTGAAALYALSTPEMHDGPELSRGMVVTGQPEAVAANWRGRIILTPCSFTENEELADAFAELDEEPQPGVVRVKIFLDGPVRTVALFGGDQAYAFEAEHLVAGEFHASAEVIGDIVVVFLIIPGN